MIDVFYYYNSSQSSSLLDPTWFAKHLLLTFPFTALSWVTQIIIFEYAVFLFNLTYIIFYIMDWSKLEYTNK